MLSRDDCTLPQLRLNTLQDLLSLLTSHLRVVLNAILPEKAAQAGVKRHRIAAKPKPLTPEEENLYKINFKEVIYCNLINQRDFHALSWSRDVIFFCDFRNSAANCYCENLQSQSIFSSRNFSQFANCAQIAKY